MKSRIYTGLLIGPAPGAPAPPAYEIPFIKALGGIASRSDEEVLLVLEDIRQTNTNADLASVAGQALRKIERRNP